MCFILNSGSRFSIIILSSEKRVFPQSLLKVDKNSRSSFEKFTFYSIILKDTQLLLK